MEGGRDGRPDVWKDDWYVFVLWVSDRIGGWVFWMDGWLGGWVD